MPKVSICHRQSECGLYSIDYTGSQSYWLLHQTQSLFTLRPEWLLTPISCISVITTWPVPGLDLVQPQACDRQRWCAHTVINQTGGRSLMLTPAVEQVGHVIWGLHWAFVVIPNVETTGYPGNHSTISVFKVVHRSNIWISVVPIWSEDFKMTSSHFC